MADKLKVVIYQGNGVWHFRPANFSTESQIPFSHDYPTKAAAEAGAKAWLERNE